MDKKISVTVLMAFLMLFVSISIFAKEKDMHFSVTAQPSAKTVKTGEKFKILFTVTFDKGWHSYSLKEQVGPDGIGPTPTEIKLKPDNLLKIEGKISHTSPKVKFDSSFNMKVEAFYGKTVFTIPAVALKNIDFSKDKAVVNLYLQQCTEQMCLPGIEFNIKVSDKVAGNDQLSEVKQEAIDNKSNNTVVGTSKIEPAKKAVNDVKITDSQSEIEKYKKKGVWSFLWFAMSAGAFALLTPCVFPMVPITVSFFTKRAEKKRGKGLRDSIVYALGIISTFTAIGFILAGVFGASGIQNFATSPWTNIGIAAIFIIFSLNLFGAFEIQLPTSILNKLNAKSEGGGIVSVLLMGLTFSLTSFTCTVPFVGSALISAAGGEWFYPIIGMLGFSAVFASPFFLLALFPSAMNKLPRAGGWMNNVKVVMGFLEIAAAIKFISNADLVWSMHIMPRELFLGIWIGVAILITIYILGLFRLRHDSPVDSVGSLRIIFSIFFVSVAFYLFSGLGGKPLGEIDAFLPPPDYQQIMGNATAGTSTSITVTSNGSKTEVSDSWLTDYKAGLKKAKEENKILFVDFSGFTCTNCRWMELNMFPKTAVKDLMDKMVKVRLFTDRREEPYLSNKKMQQERYNSIELPLYVLMTPDEKLLGTKAFTRDENEFIRFLQKGTVK